MFTSTQSVSLSGELKDELTDKASTFSFQFLYFSFFIYIKNNLGLSYFCVFF